MVEEEVVPKLSSSLPSCLNLGALAPQEWPSASITADFVA